MTARVLVLAFVALALVGAVVELSCVASEAPLRAVPAPETGDLVQPEPPFASDVDDALLASPALTR